MSVNEYIEMSEKSINSIQERIKKEIEGYMKKSEIKISDPTRITRTSIDINKRRSALYDMPSRDELKSNYDELSKDKIKGNALEKAKVYAEVIYQPDIKGELILREGSKELAKIEIACTLPEHSQVFGNFWIGKDIESLSLQDQIKDFKTKMSGLRIANVWTDKFYEKGTVNNIKTSFNYG